jgi:hypothetical protein
MGLKPEVLALAAARDTYVVNGFGHLLQRLADRQVCGGRDQTIPQALGESGGAWLTAC